MVDQRYGRYYRPGYVCKAARGVGNNLESLTCSLLLVNLTEVQISCYLCLIIRGTSVDFHPMIREVFRDFRGIIRGG